MPGWSKQDRNAALGIAAIHRLFSTVPLDNGRMGTAKVAVKETSRADQGNMFYTIEAVDLMDEPSASSWIVSGAEADGIDAKTILAEGLQDVVQAVDDFNAAYDAVASARAALEAEADLTLRMGDGPDARAISLADLLDDLDRDDALTWSMTSCSLKGTPK